MLNEHLHVTAILLSLHFPKKVYLNKSYIFFKNLLPYSGTYINWC